MELIAIADYGAYQVGIFVMRNCTVMRFIVADSYAFEFCLN